MHEIDMALELIKAVDEVTKSCPRRKVSGLKVKLGQARGVDPLALKAAFDWIKPDTVARETELKIELVPISVRCALCERTFSSEEMMPTCPRCGAMGGQILTGNEFEVASIELSPASDATSSS